MHNNKSRRVHWASCLIGLMSLIFVQSFYTAQASGTAEKRPPLNIGVSFAIPPWVIPETNTGIELDILREAFKVKGYQVAPNYLSFAMSYSLFEANKLDGILNVTESSVKKGFYSVPVLTFQNVAISLQEKNFPHDLKLNFLADKSIIAFQKASIILGDEFKHIVAQNMRYQEVAKQSLQINLLMIRDVDFIIMEKNIFGYYWQQAQSDPHLIRARSKLNRPVQIHHLFEPTAYRFVFASEQIRNDFNMGLEVIKLNGIYDAIFERYAHLRDLHSRPNSK